MTTAPDDVSRRRRLRRLTLALACLLIAGGLVVLLLLSRMPLPLRILVGLGDVFTGLVLLVLVRQKLPGTPPAPALPKGGKRKP